MCTQNRVGDDRSDDLLPVVVRGCLYIGRVTADADAVLHEALELSPEDRAEVAAELLASLEPADDPEAIRTLWAKELETRARSFLSGRSPGEDWAIVRQRLADEFAG
jgi:hypothetical protein